MAEYQEEIYLIEKREITDDEGDDSDFEKMQQEAAAMELGAGSGAEDSGDGLDDDDDDLNDFNALKTKTALKQAKQGRTVTS